MAYTPEIMVALFAPQVLTALLVPEVIIALAPDIITALIAPEFIIGLLAFTIAYPPLRKLTRSRWQEMQSVDALHGFAAAAMRERSCIVGLRTQAQTDRIKAQKDAIESILRDFLQLQAEAQTGLDMVQTSGKLSASLVRDQQLMLGRMDELSAEAAGTRAEFDTELGRLTDQVAAKDEEIAALKIQVAVLVFVPLVATEYLWDCYVQRFWGVVGFLLWLRSI
ncbi:hypothetical protein C8J57DRAFT_1469200 [Mycena rebaudengoi]|nr:hypothetical protein C8J57DRAFT_1469200 [Mycena rebaudengoi]